MTDGAKKLSQVDLRSFMNHSTRYLNCAANWYRGIDGADNLPGSFFFKYLFLHHLNDMIELFSWARVFLDDVTGSI